MYLFLSYKQSLIHVLTLYLLGRTRPLAWRIRQLEALKSFLTDNYEALITALYCDLRKGRLEAIIFEVDFVLNDINGALMNIGIWAQPEPIPRTLMTLIDTSTLHSEPLGLVLLLGAWNYPVQITLSPLVGAIAAGNCVVIKPSEQSPATAALLERLKSYLDNEAFLIVNGGVEEATELLKERYDIIFYTGSVNVGKIIYAAAQKYLTPVVLELGGKSPVYIHPDVDLGITTRRVLWGKFVNAGQTCVAPDYVICHEQIYDQFISTAKRIIREFFGDDPKSSPDFGRIVTTGHAERLVRLMRGADIVVGGIADPDNRYVAPTIVKNVQGSDPLMQEEIFGPILPVMKVKGLDDAIQFINSRDKPLTAYLFARDQRVISLFTSETSSGSLCINDVLVHLSNEGLPFGGVGTSGMGRYHGKYTFDCFSNKKAVMQRDFSYIGEIVGKKRYPPYTEKNLQLFKIILKRRGRLLGPFRPFVLPLFWATIGILFYRYLLRFL